MRTYTFPPSGSLDTAELTKKLLVVLIAATEVKEDLLRILLVVAFFEMVDVVIVVGAGVVAAVDRLFAVLVVTCYFTSES